jgi:hypothetical protein
MSRTAYQVGEFTNMVRSLTHILDPFSTLGVVVKNSRKEDLTNQETNPDPEGMGGSLWVKQEIKCFSALVLWLLKALPCR